MHSHARVQSCCCAIAGTSALPVTGVGRLRGTVLVRCALCLHREAVPLGTYIVNWFGWCTGIVLLVGYLVVLVLLLEQYFGLFVASCVAIPLLLSPRNKLPNSSYKSVKGRSHGVDEFQRTSTHT